MNSEPVKPRVDLGPMIQVGLVVRDAEAAVQAWTARFHFPPARFVDWPPAGRNLEETGTYHGRPAHFRMRLAFIETPSIQLEFIQPLEGDNIYADWLEAHGEGLHHILFEVDDPEAVAAGLNAPILQSGGSTLRPGALWTYLDTQELLGCILEFRTRVAPSA
ncbi:MAG: VOC family protein [Caldilineaceae bacterium]|nr:VOC family protein [Caldilineaceae bacterium]